MNTSRFEALPMPLNGLLGEIKSGKIQLPDFQRGWVWDDYHIRSLIASVSQAFPIGAVMMLETGNPDVRFKPRIIEGVNPKHAQNEPEKLILDGQQRLTALFQSLMSNQGVYTLDARGKKHIRYYYLDMDQCIKDEIDREEAVLSCREDLKLQTFLGKSINLLSTQQNHSVKEEYANAMFPVSRIFDADDWGDGYKEFWADNTSKKNLFNQFNREVIECFNHYDVPVIRLKNNTEREAVCLVFEKVNTRGVTLTVFELLTASFAADGFDLREDWEMRKGRMKEEYPVLEGVDKVNFLQAVTLLTIGSCRRKEILELTTAKYQELACQVENGFKIAADFLDKQNILTARDLPYPPQLVPLAAILAKLGDVGKNEETQQKIARWYWCGIFGEMYGSATETRFANDLSEVIPWVRGKENSEPSTIRAANFYADRLLELRNRNSAAYKGVYALLLQGCDFHTGHTIRSYILANVNIDTHHIFPKTWCCEKYGISSRNFTSSRFNSIINKTPLLENTNRSIGGEAPSKYLNEIERLASQLTLFQESDQATTVEDKLNSHFISTGTLQTDDFEGFFKARKEALLNAIEKAMGKKVIHEGDDPPDPSSQ